MTKVALSRPLKLHSSRGCQSHTVLRSRKGSNSDLAGKAVYAPILNAEEQKGACYGDLQDTGDRVPAKDILIVAGN